MAERDSISCLRAWDPAGEERVDRHLDEAARSRIESMTRDRLLTPELGTRRQASSRPASRMWAAVAAAVASAAAAAFVLSSTGYEPSDPLAGFASTAAAQQPLAPFEFVDWVYDWEKKGIDRKLQIWAGADERFERRRFSFDGSRAGGDATYTSRELGVQCRGDISGSKIRCQEIADWFLSVEGILRRQDAALRKAEADLRGTVGTSPRGSSERPIGLPVDSFPASFDAGNVWQRLWLEAPGLPSDRDELRSALEGQIAHEFERGIDGSDPTTGSESGGGVFFYPVQPLSELPEESRSIVLQEGLFSKLTAILSHPFTPPELRGSAFELLGTLPTVSVEEEGDASVRIAFDRPQRGPGGPAGLESYELEIDPETTQVLSLTRSARYGRPGKVRYKPRATETFLERRAVGELPAEAAPFRRAAELYERDR